MNWSTWVRQIHFVLPYATQQAQRGRTRLNRAGGGTEERPRRHTRMGEATSTRGS